MRLGWGVVVGGSKPVSMRPDGRGLGTTDPPGRREEAQLGRMLVPGWDQMVRGWRGLGQAGWAAIWRILPAWGQLPKVNLPAPERPREL